MPDLPHADLPGRSNVAHRALQGVLGACLLFGLAGCAVTFGHDDTAEVNTRAPVEATIEPAAGALEGGIDPFGCVKKCDGKCGGAAAAAKVQACVEGCVIHHGDAKC